MKALRYLLICLLGLMALVTSVSAGQRLLIEFDGQRHQLLRVIDIEDHAAAATGESISAGPATALLHWWGPQGPGHSPLSDPRQLRSPAEPGRAGHAKNIWRTGGLYSVVVSDDADLDTLVIELPATSMSKETKRIEIGR